MPTTSKRKGSPILEEDAASSKRRFAETEAVSQNDATAEESKAESGPGTAPTPASEKGESKEASASNAPPGDRAARFAALRARNQSSRKANLHETKTEARRAATDPSQLTAINRKKDVAQHKLFKADTEASGEDFERKRAWDWTIEESEKWDERLAGKKANKDRSGFADYQQEAGKVYDRQIGEMERKGFGERKAAYERDKQEAVDRAIRSGGLEIVETPDGELIAVDKDGSFYSTADTTHSFQSKPDKAAVDRLVEDIKKAEEVRLKKRKDRGKQDDGDPDVTYINEKNKQFNQKLARFYNKYTGEIRESFERGTAM